MSIPSATWLIIVLKNEGLKSQFWIERLTFVPAGTVETICHTFSLVKVVASSYLEFALLQNNQSSATMHHRDPRKVFFLKIGCPAVNPSVFTNFD